MTISFGSELYDKELAIDPESIVVRFNWGNISF